jgi:hypothetical protein
MEDKLMKSFNEQTEIMLCNMRITLNTCNTNVVVYGMPIWKHLYHTLHSLDRWFINPEKYIVKY